MPPTSKLHSVLICRNRTIRSRNLSVFRISRLRLNLLLRGLDHWDDLWPFCTRSAGMEEKETFTIFASIGVWFLHGREGCCVSCHCILALGFGVKQAMLLRWVDCILSFSAVSSSARFKIPLLHFLAVEAGRKQDIVSR